MSTPPLIAGLYPYTRNGVTRPPRFTLAEIPESLRVNPWYRERLTVLAGDRTSAEHLRGFGLRPTRIFDDAPPEIQRDAAHKMKHWMCRWALREFGEALWVDWDTVTLKDPDDALWARCRSSPTPRFIRIPGYWATVNCGVYYVPSSWAEAMDASFGAAVEEPNDELLWRAVLPRDVIDRAEFWWAGEAAHVEKMADFEQVGPTAYFAHIKKLGWADALRHAVRHRTR